MARQVATFKMAIASRVKMQIDNNVDMTRVGKTYASKVGQAQKYTTHTNSKEEQSNKLRRSSSVFTRIRFSMPRIIIGLGLCQLNEVVEGPYHLYANEVEEFQ